jgi:thioredoxin-like negative regulator of GroEL
MSLINKMLSDLEQRHSYQKDHDQIVLGGLAPVVNTGFSSLKLPYHFLIVCFFVIAVLIAVYGFWTNQPEPEPASLDTSLLSRSVIPDVINIAPSPEQTAIPAAPVPTDAPAPALKLDITLPGVDNNEIANINTATEISQVSIEQEANFSTVQSATAVQAEYLPAIEYVVPATESGYGQMDIRPASVSIDPLLVQIDEASAYYERRNFGEGDTKLAAILEQEPLHIQARSLYASSLAERGQTALAGQVLAAGLEINPAIAVWARQYAYLLVAEDKVTEAVSVLRRSLPALENNEQYYALYAALLQRMTRHQEAAAYYQSLLTRQPGNSLWWMGLAISQEGLQSPAQALASYRRAMQGNTLNQELKQYVSRQIGRLEKK